MRVCFGMPDSFNILAAIADKPFTTSLLSANVPSHNS